MPRRRRVGRSPGAPFWGDSSLLVEPRRGPAEDRDLLLELPGPAARRADLGRFLTASTRPAAVVNIVLSQPVVEGDLVDTEVQCGLLDLRPPRTRAIARARNSGGYGRGVRRAFHEDHRLATSTGNLAVGQVNVTPTRASVPNSLQCDAPGKPASARHLATARMQLPAEPSRRAAE